MDDTRVDNLQDKVLQFIKSNILIVGLFLAGMILLGIGLIQILGQKQTQIKFEKGAVLGSGDLGGSGVKIKVDVEGEVMKPGVYELNSDARVQDALISAGGLTPNANRKAINLAAKIVDGQKIYVPAEGESVQRILGGSGDLGGLGLVSVNSASQVELEELPGVGPVTAQKIIDGRPYNSIEELLERKIVGKATFEKIKDLISL